jgi:hypothetical protein
MKPSSIRSRRTTLRLALGFFTWWIVVRERGLERKETKL